MKTLYKYMASSFIAMAMFSACADDFENQEILNKNQNNDFVTLSLNFQSQNDKLVEVSRSAATTEEKRLYDLHFYVFDVNGNLTGYKEVLPTGENDLIEEADNSERVSIRAKSGESYIYGVANINSSTTYYLNAADLALLNIDEGTNDEEYYRNIERSELTRDKFLSINFNRRYGADENAQISPDPVNKRFVMSGYINDGQTVTIPKGNNGSASLPEGQNIIKLYRILAKNTLTITNGTTSNGGKFTAKSYRLCNVPISGNLVPKAGINTTTSYLENNVTNADVESNFIWNFEGKNEISFYFPENLQIAKNNVTKWKDREKNSWNDRKKTFTNAADKAAYIEIYGDYVDATGEITANVSYTIHLGDFSNATGSMDNFNVIRNYNYRYNVSINGVNDIVVEATTTTDNPYAEGLVINATDGKHYDVDAHFEARVMTFTKASIQALKKNGTGYILNVKTPFGHTYETVNVKSDGIYSMTGNKLDEREIFDGEADYFWMKFVKNTEGNTYPCQYPGDNSDKCLNVFELLTELYDESAYTEKGGTEAYYTCFIDEYYYANKSWPKYVNQEPRTMLIANDLSISADGKSLYAEVAYSISQRAITTFYQTDYQPDGTNLVKAFGSEIIDEEDVYNSRLSNSSYGEISYQHDWNAWTSAYETNKGENWYSGDINLVEGIQPLYTTAAKACMSRNRDSNGNGTIDKNEVKWYLPAVEQYRALFYGQNSLNPDAYLINQEQLQEIADNVPTGTKGHEFRSKYHYFTSSSGDKETFWPEEGLTNNPRSTNSWGGYSWAELVRCIRTLESNGVGTQDPEPFYKYANNTFHLDGIVQTRDYTEDPLANHNEIEPLNNLYSSFVVAQQDLIESGNDRTFLLEDITIPVLDPCRNYAKQVAGTDEANYKWRTPNQKELALMVSEMNLSEHQYGTRTKFSGDDKWNWHITPGFWSDATEGGRINVGNENGKSDAYDNDVRIRCVRDNKRQ